MEEFLKSFIHFLYTESGKILTRPMRNALHATKLIDLLHSYFCHMMPRKYGFLYMLILKGYFSGYVWLVIII